MSTLVVGDLHGKLDIYKEIMEEKDKNIVFIGDYLDSFENNKQDQLDILEDILYQCENNDKVTALYGNHEMSYLNKKHMASGWNEVMQCEVLPLISRMRKNLKFYTTIDDYLITHAGVSKRWIQPLVILNLKDITEYLDKAPVDTLLEVGYFRGGKHRCGGPLWCDYNEEFVPIEGIKQVMGHTAWRYKSDTKTIINKYPEENWCIDCLDYSKEVLEIDNNQAKVVKL